MQIAAAAPALAAALRPNSHGSSSRASLHTGMAVFASNAPVYVASGGPLANETSPARTLIGFRMSSSSSAAAVLVAPLETKRIQLPTLIGEVTLNTRSMLRKRSGLPRSEISRIGETISAAAPTYSADFARRSFPLSFASRCMTLEPPARPPVKRYVGISGFHTGSLTIGRP